MSVVHLWRGMPNTGSFEAWCSDEVRSGHAVDVDEIDKVTCLVCLGMASDFGGACLGRLRELHLEAQAKFPDEATLRRWFRDGEPIPPGRYVVRECIPVVPKQSLAQRRAVHGMGALDEQTRRENLAVNTDDVCSSKVEVSRP